jgi:hypothetical protein
LPAALGVRETIDVGRSQESCLAGLARRFEPLPGLRRVCTVGILRAGFALWNFPPMAAMANPAGEPSGEVLRLDFNQRLMVQFRGSVVISPISVCSPIAHSTMRLG